MTSWPSKSTLQRPLDLAGLHYTTSERSGPFWQSMLHNLFVQALVISRLDYCNALLAGLPSNTIKPLQMIQNAAARLVFNEPKRAHVTPLFVSLHWLPVAARIQFKTLMLAYRTTAGSAPAYFHSLLRIYIPSRSPAYFHSLLRIYIPSRSPSYFHSLLRIYIPSRSPAYFHSLLRIYIPSRSPSYFHSLLRIYIPSRSPAYFHSLLRIYIPSRSPAYFHSLLRIYIPSRSPAYFHSLLRIYIPSRSPVYFHSLLRIYIPSRSLRSASERRLVVPSQRGSQSLSRSFSFTVPGCWNDLPTPPSRTLNPCQSSSNNWKLISFNSTWPLLKLQKKKFSFSFSSSLGSLYLFEQCLRLGVPLSVCLFKVNQFMSFPIVSRFG